MRQNTHLRSILHRAGVLALVAGFAAGLSGGAFILGAHVVYAKGDGGGGGGGGNGNGGGGKGSGGGSSDNGKGGSVGSGSSAGASDVGGGAGEGRASDGDRSSGGFFARLMGSFRLALPGPRNEPVVAPPRSFAGAVPPNARRIGSPGAPALARRVPPKETQAFRFDVGTAVFPTTGGMLTTEEVDGVDLVTVDARHHRVIHPAAFFEPHEGGQYDRRAVERFWPIAVGKRVRFVETVGSEHWLQVMDAVRAETVSVPAGVFHAFVVERTMQRIGAGPRPVTTYTYWYAPAAGVIVKTELRPGNGDPAITEEADVIGYPLPQPSAASVGALQ